MSMYSIICQNNSQMPGSFCIFQQNPGMMPSVMSVAWLAQSCYPAGMCNFMWQNNYCFVCGQTGSLVPGVTFDASQVLQADLQNNNQVNLDFNGSPMFNNQTNGRSGTLTIIESPAIPYNMLATGIGMSGSATFVTQAMPNMNLQFTPNPTYWVAFGNYNQGQVLNSNNMGNAVQVSFPSNVSQMKVVLNPDNSFTVMPA